MAQLYLLSDCFSWVELWREKLVMRWRVDMGLLPFRLVECD